MARWKEIMLGGSDSREKSRKCVNIIRHERIHMEKKPLQMSQLQ